MGLGESWFDRNDRKVCAATPVQIRAGPLTPLAGKECGQEDRRLQTQLAWGVKRSHRRAWFNRCEARR